MAKMTHEEAIKRLTYYKKPDWIRRLFMRLSKKAVKEADELNALCVEAIGRRMPKKPICENEDIYLLFWCPVCKRHIEKSGTRYCYNCGQAIKFEEEEE